MLLLVLSTFSATAQPSLSKQIAREDLEYYLSRSITVLNLHEICKTPDGFYPGTSIRLITEKEVQTPLRTDDPQLAFLQQDRLSGAMFARYQDVLRLIRNVKPKMITDLVGLWGGYDWFNEHSRIDWPIFLTRCQVVANDIHQIDSTIVLQAAIGENITQELVDGIGNIPKWVFDEFGLDSVARPFSLSDIWFEGWDTTSNGLRRMEDHGCPDISRQETKMFFYFMGRTYIDMGFESLNFCQVERMNDMRTDGSDWEDVCNRLRSYADGVPGVRFLLTTGHTNGMKSSLDRLVFNFHSSPVRLDEADVLTTHANGGGCVISPERCSWNADKIYGNSKGGLNPSGWYCQNSPGLVFVDNWASDWDAGKPSEGKKCAEYGFDEITWFALQDERYRNNWLRYAYQRVRELDKNIYFAAPVMRIIDPSNPPGKNPGNKTGFWAHFYMANNPVSVAEKPTLLPAPNTLDGVEGGLVDRWNVQVYAGYGQEEVIRELFEKLAN